MSALCPSLSTMYLYFTYHDYPRLSDKIITVMSDGGWEKPTFEPDFSTQLVSLEWIQSLPLELKDAALYRLCKVVEAKPTMVE